MFDHSKFFLAALLSAALLIGCGSSQTKGPQNPTPQDPTAENKEMPEDLKAEATDDPFLWLEEVQGEKPLAWARTQNEKTFSVLKKDARYEGIKDNAQAILDAKDRIPHGAIRGGFVYNFWRDDKNIRGIWRRIPLNDYLSGGEAWEPLLDIDKLAESEGENWVYHGVDCRPPDFNRCILSLSRGGKDASVKREFDLKTLSFVDGGFELPEAKSETAWLDEDTLLIGMDFGDGSMTTSGYPRTQRVWKRGTPLSSAEQIFEIEEKDVWAWGWVNEGPAGRTTMLIRGVTFYTSEAHLLGEDLRSTIKLPLPIDVELVGLFQNNHLVSTLRTDWETGGVTYPQGSVVSIDLRPFKKALAEGMAGEIAPTVELIFTPDERSSVRSVHISRDEILLSLLTDVKSRVARMQRSGDAWKRVDFPLPAQAGVASLMSISEYEDDFFVLYEDPITPESLHHFNFKTGELTPVRSIPDRFDSEGMRVEQRYATSKDGTKVPYFLLLPKGFSEGTPSPTYLYAYGGFEVSMLPYYRPITGKFWVERGGVFVVANIRGGGEYGPRWHQAALKANRQLAYDDFHAVAEHLVETGVTTREQLGIHGGSNGGLLMGVALTQRPELYKAIICEVPLLDMMRYHKLLAGASWMAEYGDPDVPEEREFIKEYSPYQNVDPDADYPRVFFTTSTADDRVHPGHARKMAAKMIEQGHDLFYFENIEGGHGGVTNNKQRAMTTGLKFVYLMRELGLK